MSYLVKFQTTIDPPWTALEPLRLGTIPPGHGTPDVYVTLEQDGQPSLRIDLYATDEFRCFQEAIPWKQWLAVGYGEKAYLVNPASRRSQVIGLEEYFGSFHPTDDALLVATARRIVGLDPNGHVTWRSTELGLDGVVIDRVDAGFVYGRGEWDPPGGWKPFQLSFETGSSRRPS